MNVRCCDYRYEWRMNGVSLDSQVSSTRNFLHVGKGSVRFTELRPLNEGFYQCLAMNDHGTAMSNVTFLRRAILATYTSTVVEEKQLLQGQPFVLKYKPTKSVPPPTFSWSITASRVSTSQTSVVTDKRVQIDEDGERSSVSV